MKMIIGGKKTDSKSGEVIDVINPATQEFIDTVPVATKEDIDECLEYAQKGKKEWAAKPTHERSSIIIKCADALAEHRDELADLLSRETGKTIIEAEAEVGQAAFTLRSYAEKANNIYGKVMPDMHPGMEKDIVFTRREPLGVVVCIIPFNYPFVLLTLKLAPALATGNAVIVKPASDNPLAIIRYVEILLENGIPGNALQVVTGRGGTIGKWLVANPKINAVSLTGSTEVGIEIAREASQYLHRVFLELGGNDALIIFDDADLELAVNESIYGRISTTGQICCAPKRFIVQKGIKEKFVSGLVDRIKKVRIGNPQDRETDMGCLISEKAAIKVEEDVLHTIRQGAKCVYGGKRFNKTFFEPTVLVDVTPEMDIAKDMEVFGPVFPIIEFETAEEAVRIANSSIYGLCGGVISSDTGKAINVAAELECGIVGINGSGCYDHLQIPFGGYKMSGLGREGLTSSLDEMTQIKSYVLRNILK